MALRQISPDLRHLLVQISQAILAATFIVIRWLLIFMALGVFSLTFAMFGKDSDGLVDLIVYYIVLTIGLLILAAMIIYTLVKYAGGMSLRKFGKAVLPAQIVALSTRSSIACLPALVNGAESCLRMPSSLISTVLPICVTSFKTSRSIVSSFKLLFLAKVHGLELETVTILFFVGMQIFLSMYAPGIPEGGIALGLPLYLAVGIPVESYILLRTIGVIPDMVVTALNTTADMSILVFVNRILGKSIDQGTPA